MPQVDIPQDLLQQIDAVRPASVSATEFVTQAVRAKIETARQLETLLRLTDENRRAMLAKGLTEEEILADFQARRKTRPDPHG